MTTVFIDVDTQLDFLFPAGALYVPGGERIVPAIAALNRHAGARGIPLISTTDAQAENDPEFKDWPPHCVAGTLGARKPASTLLDSVVSIPSVRSSFSIAGAKQIILEKQTIDAFTNANLPGILESLGADRYVVYGVVTEVCVKCAVAGLLKTGKPVAIVGDAVRHLNEDAAREVLSMCAVTSVSRELAA